MNKQVLPPLKDEIVTKEREIEAMLALGMMPDEP